MHNTLLVCKIDNAPPPHDSCTATDRDITITTIASLSRPTSLDNALITVEDLDALDALPVGTILRSTFNRDDEDELIVKEGRNTYRFPAIDYTIHNPALFLPMVVLNPEILDDVKVDALRAGDRVRVTTDAFEGIPTGSLGTVMAIEARLIRVDIDGMDDKVSVPFYRNELELTGIEEAGVETDESACTCDEDITVKRSELIEVRDFVQDMVEEHTALKGSEKLLRVVISSMGDRITELRAEVAELTKINDDLHAENQRIDDENSELHGSVHTLGYENGNLAGEIDDLRDEYNDLRDENSELHQAVIDLRSTQQ